MEYKNPNDNFFTILVIPDSQGLAFFPDLFKQHIRWIVDNKEERKIAFVVHVGDVVQFPNSTEQWTTASESMQLLQEANISFLVIPGNHDLDDNDSFSKYFPDGHNVYSFFNTSDGLEFIVIGCEYDPSLETLQWVNDTLNKHPDKYAILFTHSYMGRNGKRTSIGDYIWNYTVRYHDNIMLVLSGHVTNGRNNLTVSHGCTGYREDNNVHQLLANYQDDISGTLRWYECYPDVDKIFVRTYSPLLDEWMICKNNSFILEYDFLKPDE